MGLGLLPSMAFGRGKCISYGCRSWPYMLLVTQVQSGASVPEMTLLSLLRNT